MSVFNRLCPLVLFWQNSADAMEMRTAEFQGLPLKSQQFWQDLNADLFACEPWNPLPHHGLWFGWLSFATISGERKHSWSPMGRIVHICGKIYKALKTNLSPHSLVFIYLAHIQEAVLFLWTLLPLNTQIPKKKKMQFENLVSLIYQECFLPKVLSQKHLFFQEHCF